MNTPMQTTEFAEMHIGLQCSTFLSDQVKTVLTGSDSWQLSTNWGQLKEK